MRMNLLKKLHDRRGASLSFALLLFLVCAAVGSVVLASATAAAGRASGLPEYDRRYFAVTSAADLLRETIGGEGQTFTIEVTKKSYHWKSVETLTDANGIPVAGAGVVNPIYDSGNYADDDATYPAVYELALLRADGTRIDLSAVTGPNDLLGGATASLLSGKTAKELFTAPLYDAAGTAAVDWIGVDPTDIELPETMKLTVTPAANGSAAISELTAEIKPELVCENGRLTLLLNVSNDEGDDKYTLQVAVPASVNENMNAAARRTSDVRYAALDPVTVQKGSYQSTTLMDVYQKSVTRSVTVSWRVASAGKAG